MNKGKYILLFIFLLLLTVGMDYILDNWHFKEGDHRRLQQAVDMKFSEADRIYNRLKDNNWSLNSELPTDAGIIMLVYREDSLIYWSDNTFSFSDFEHNLINGKRFDFVSNGWYIIKPYISDSIRAYGLVLIKYQYPYENDFLKNSFQPDFKLPVSTELLIEPLPGTYAIHDWEGIYLFSIRFNMDELRLSNVEKFLSPFMLLMTLFAFLLALHHVIQSIIHIRIRNKLILFLPLLFIAVRWIQYRYHIPHDIYELELFSPIPFAKSEWLPSLGDVFLNTMLLLYVIVEFFLGYTTPIKAYSGRTTKSILTISFMLLLLSGLFVFSHVIISNLILHSIISFEFYKAATLSTYTFIGLVIMAMYFAGFLFISNKLLTLCKMKCNFTRLLLLFACTTIVVFVAVFLAGYSMDIGSRIFYVVMFCTLATLQYKRIPLGNYTAMTLMVVLFSAYTVYIITYCENKKTISNMTVIAENLSAQHDPVAEYLLEDISEKLSNDQTLNNYMFNWAISTEQIHKYLQSTYFNGFWGKYKLWIKDCGPVTAAYFDTDTLTLCYDYYSNRMEEGKSMQIPGTRFYFLDPQNGRINYLGWITYKRPGRRGEVSLFIELESRLVAEELGFPELLLDKKYQKNKLLEDYSYAKYYKNQLLAQSGTFQYSLNLTTYKDKAGKSGGYYHYISDQSKDNVVIVSKPITTFFNNIVSFSYVFIFYYIIILVFIGIRDFSKLGRDIEFNFKNKIQFSITALIFLSLFLVGGGSIYLSLQQFQKKQHDILSEKIQSVYVELDHLLAYLPNRISPDWKGDDYENLNQLLIKFSDVFYTDINLYDPNGNLLATSRSEIFQGGLLGEKMDPLAYDKMVNGKQAEFIHKEKIGALSFLSAYVPFMNTDNKLLAYLNLPYFTKQNVLRNEVTTLVVAIVNIYVLLILLTIALAAIISDQITRPLRMIQQKFSQIKIGKKSQEIVYKGRDEIAGLVDEYNRMVKELVKSVEMLARSERESAWREMAKQVAHEIKNPLTPMKLSVQHLKRTWDDNKENFDEYLEKVTRTLIEQIDNLSFIASEFSNFAKMPKAINEAINVADSIRSAITLFSNTENIDFVFENESDSIVIMADKEQLSRVFINLLKNAIQSIPDNRQGKIVVGLVLNGDKARISVADNGKGIPADLQNKLFTPSFTTKSSGMGLGLSIVKSIIESFGGNITFKTKVNAGTTFIIELPVYQSMVSMDEQA